MSEDVVVRQVPGRAAARARGRHGPRRGRRRARGHPARRRGVRVRQVRPASRGATAPTSPSRPPMTDLQRETIDFGGLRIAFDERVLRPRTWTENQSRWAAELLPALPGGRRPRAVLGRRPDRAARRRRQRPPARVRRHQPGRGGADPRRTPRPPAWRTAWRCARAGSTRSLEPGERFPLIIADPPWVPRAETQRFPEDPLLAIDGGDDGLIVVRECVAAIALHLAIGGVALLQLGPGDQAAAVTRLLGHTGLRPTETREFGERGVLLRIDASTHEPAPTKEDDHDRREPGSSVRHLHARRRPARRPPRLRHDAAARRGRLGSAEGPRRGHRACCVARSNSA